MSNFCRVSYATRQEAPLNQGFTANSAKKMAAAMEKVFVALPAEFKAGQSTLSWVLSHFGSSGTTVVITHVHVPPQMIPVMGVKFHSSKLSPEQVKLFRRIEHEKVDKQLDDYVHHCSKKKVKCEKLVFEKEDTTAGLVELIVLHRVTKLVISAAADRQYSRIMNKSKSRTATEIMQRADPSCKIWFVCKGQLIGTRGKEDEIAPSVKPLPPDFNDQALQLVPFQKEDDVQPELGLYDELREACIAAENLMKRALNESSRRQKADEEVAFALQKAKEYQELYLEEARKCEELEVALARAHREIARLRLKQADQVPVDEQSTATDELQEAMSERLSLELEGHTVDMDVVSGTAGEATEAEKDHVQFQIDVQALLDQSSKLAVFSPSSVIQSPYDEDRVPSSYFLCPVLQEPMREPHVTGGRVHVRGGRRHQRLARRRKQSVPGDRPAAGAPRAGTQSRAWCRDPRSMVRRRAAGGGGADDSHDAVVAVQMFLPLL